MTQASTSSAESPRVDLERLGGEAAIERWVRSFYAKVAQDPVLSPMFEDLERAREKQQAYFVEFFGGPNRYTQQYGRPFLRFKHRQFRIGRPERDAWMRLAMEAFREEVSSDATVVDEVERKLGGIADAMMNYDPERHDAYYFQR